MDQMVFSTEKLSDRLSSGRTVQEIKILFITMRENTIGLNNLLKTVNKLQKVMWYTAWQTDYWMNIFSQYKDIFAV